MKRGLFLSFRATLSLFIFTGSGHMKVINIILGIIFIAFAVLQINDPDPLVWTAIYGGMAVLSFMAALGRYRVWILLVALLVILYELITLFPEISGWMEAGMPSITGSMKAESPHVEFVREFIGILICFVVLAFHFYGYRQQVKTRG
jgi:hypothetical protein